MSKIIASINMTLDGYCDHTAMIADENIHRHYTELLRNAGAIIYGRTTYQLMESAWPVLVKNPSGTRSMDEFAVVMDNVQKIVFSHTLKNVGWKNSILAKGEVEEEVLKLKERQDEYILVGSRSLIVELTKLNLIDEYQLCIHPVIVGEGLPLFKDIDDRIVLRLLKTKTFDGGQMINYYEPEIS